MEWLVRDFNGTEVAIIEGTKEQAKRIAARLWPESDLGPRPRKEEEAVRKSVVYLLADMID